MPKPSIAQQTDSRTFVRRALPKLAVLAGVVAALYGLYAYEMYSNQLALIFPGGNGAPHAFTAKLPDSARLIQLPASFGSVRAIYLAPPSGAPAPALIFAHGNFDHARDYVDAFAGAAQNGLGVLLLEYPGYDGADGETGLATLTEACERAYDWLAVQPQIDARRIIGVGYSVGGGVIANLTRTRKLAGLALISTYTALADFAHGYYLPEFLLKVPFDNVARLHDFAMPVLIVHGTRDTTIPFAAGQALAHAAPHGTFIALDCGHTDCGLANNVFGSALPQWLRAQRILAP